MDKIQQIKKGEKMQIKNTNYQISQPNFQARYLSRSVSTAAKNRAESVIDIYSLNKNDKNFIERVLNLLKEIEQLGGKIETEEIDR